MVIILKFSVLPGCPFPGQTEQAFVRGFFGFVLTGISWWLTSSASRGHCRESRELTTVFLLGSYLP